MRGLKKRLRMAAALTGLAAALAACGPATAPSRGEQIPAVDAELVEMLMIELADAKPGDVITLAAGRYELDRGLALASPGVTLRGAGMDQSVLSFRGQIAGAEGLLVTGGNVIIEDLAIEDAKGDALKITGVDNVIIRRVRTEWTNGPDTKNGAYGIYPVQTRNVLIEGVVAIAASDAGIYVGQSRDVVVRDSRAEFNVAGIEIENTVNADVFGNVATNNTGGILVFNMPNLPMSGDAVRVFANRVNANNTANFGAEGTAVATIPAGSGVVVNAHDGVEIFDNDIADNKTANIIISSYFSTGYMTKEGVAAAFDPYPERIMVRANRFSGGGDAPDGLELTALKVLAVGPTGRLPDILWDGYAKTARDAPPVLCLDNAPAAVLNADVPNGSKQPRVIAAPSCALPALSPVALDLAWAQGR